MQSKGTLIRISMSLSKRLPYEKLVDFNTQYHNAQNRGCIIPIDTTVLGNSGTPHARTGGVLIFAQRRVKHTNTIFYVVRQIAYIHGRESILFRD